MLVKDLNVVGKKYNLSPLHMKDTVVKEFGKSK